MQDSDKAMYCQDRNCQSDTFIRFSSGIHRLIPAAASAANLQLKALLRANDIDPMQRPVTASL
jgi:hypothetical protein